MKNVLYVLGAGFSAPLGLPLMSNFISKSKDMFSSEPEKFSFFSTVYKNIDRLSRSNLYMNCDLHNVEEILSILEMEAFINGSSLSDEFNKFIADVIRFYTPPIKPYGTRWPANWKAQVFGNDPKQRSYGVFISSLANVQIFMQKQLATGVPRELCFKPGEERNVRYGVISLNYDMVVESYLEFLEKQLPHPNRIAIYSQHNEERNCFENIGSLSMAKIHGTLEPIRIIPPTWNKINARDIAPIWTLARNLISHANEIRFIGYSLPATDSYMKYLVTTGITKAAEHFNLKQVDVLCLDANGSVKNRYESLFQNRNFRFRNASVEDYLERITKGIDPMDTGENLHFDHIEKAHEQFFSAKSAEEHG